MNEEKLIKEILKINVDSEQKQRIIAYVRMAILETKKTMNDRFIRDLEKIKDGLK